ncbi:MAG: methyltransferase domain-containing protein [Desulfosoma sp.]
MEELSFPFSVYRRIVKGHDLHFGYWDDDTASLEDAQNNLTALMLERIQGESLSVLDVGCGFGHFAQQLALRGHRVTALAPEPPMIRYAETHCAHPKVTFLCEPFEGRHPSWWKPGSYDWIVFFESTQYFPSLSDLFNACRELLRSNGRILLCDEMIYEEDSARETAVKPKRAYTISLAEAGFKIRHNKAIGPRTAPTCAAVLERLSDLPPGEDRDRLAAGWHKQKRMHESGAWGYEIIEAEKDAYCIRPCPQEDDPALVDLFCRIFSVPRSIEHWRWKYRECPFGRDAVAVCRDGEDRIVANFSGYFVPVEDIESDATPAAVLQVGDTMTHPGVRHVGFGKTSVLVRTALYFFARYCDHQVPFVYGFNTGNIQKMGKLFLGYRPVYPVDEYTAAVDALAVSKASMLRYSCRSFEKFGPDHDALYERAKRAYGRFLVVRKSPYLNWRFADPDRNYVKVEVRRRFGGLAAYMVAEKKSNGAVVGDFFVDPAHPQALARGFQWLGRALGVHTLSLWLSKAPEWLTGELRTIGFQHQPEPQGLWFVYVPFQRPLDTGDMHRFFFTRADSDLF